MAKIVLNMHTRDFDIIEKRAATAIADELNGDLNVPAAELPAFVLWVIEQYADNMRKQIDGGGPPF